MPWSVVTADTQAVENSGYFANGDVLSTITLPPSAGLPVGSAVAVVGLGEGGFRLKANAGQTISFAATATWRAQGPTAYWTGVASSADGKKLVVLTPGQIYTSTDAGVTWTATASTGSWTGVASSADGSKILAIAARVQLVSTGPFIPGKIIGSTDSGRTWESRGGDEYWQGVTMSADGRKAAVVFANGPVYVWSTSWNAIAGSTGSSATLYYAGNGTFVVAAGYGVLTPE